MSTPGPKGQPQFSGADNVTIAEYLSALGNYSALVGNRLVGTASQRTAFVPTYSFAPFRGLEFFESDTFNSYTHDGTNWIGTKTQAGIVAFTSGNFTAEGGGFSVSTAVNFVPGRFTVAPAVNVTPISAASQNMHAGATNITTTGFTLYYWRANQTATSLSWSAVPTETG